MLYQNKHDRKECAVGELRNGFLNDLESDARYSRGRAYIECLRKPRGVHDIEEAETSSLSSQRCCLTMC